MQKIKDEELRAYQEKIGSKEYRTLYMNVLNRTKQRTRNDIRHSKTHYANSEEKLNAIKQKYKNGVTKEILAEWLGGER